MPPSNTCPATSRRVLIILNPVAGRRRPERFPAILRGLEGLGCAVTVRRTGRAGEAETLAREALGEGFDVMVAAGGDGTINEVINGLAGSRQPLAILPLGTANALAAEIELPDDPAALAELIAQGRSQPVCFGRANGRCFILMAGIGLDAQVVAGVDLALKRRIGKLAYIWQAMREILRGRPNLYSVEVDGKQYQAASVIAAKGHFYGGRFICAPEARLQDPLLQVCLLERPGRLNAIRYAVALALGRLSRLPDCRIVPARQVLVAAPAGDPVQVDGDALTCLPVRIDLAEEQLELILPENA